MFAQAPEVVSVRAQGMGGAFVAVADDATATHWNPAGLINAPLVDVTLERGASRDFFRPSGQSAPSGASRNRASFFAFALPSLGFSYLRSVTENVTAPTAPRPDSRDIDRTGSAAVSRLVTDRVGVTLLQSLTSRLVVGTTVKVVRGSFASSLAPFEALRASLDDAGRLTGRGSTKVDFDLGLLASIGPVRFGLAGRNLLRPDFSGSAGADAGDTASFGRLPRQVRAGVAVTPGFGSRTAAARPTLTISLDVDLTKTTVPGTGDERRMAAGVERWFGGRRVALRGGVLAAATGDRRVLATAGASVAIRSNVFIDGYVGRGRGAGAGTDAARAWGVAGRAGF